MTRDAWHLLAMLRDAPTGCWVTLTSIEQRWPGRPPPLGPLLMEIEARGVRLTHGYAKVRLA